MHAGPGLLHREELKARGITATAVCPGPMDTDFIVAGGIKGHSKTFELLPYCDPAKVAKGARFKDYFGCIDRLVEKALRG